MKDTKRDPMKNPLLLMAFRVVAIGTLGDTLLAEGVRGVVEFVSGGRMTVHVAGSSRDLAHFILTGRFRKPKPAESAPS